MGLAVLLYERASMESRLFLLMAHLGAGWQIAYSLMLSAPNLTMATEWGRVAYVFIPFLFPAVYHFSTSVLRLEEQRKRVIRVAWLTGAFCAGIMAGTDAIIRGAYQYDWGYYLQLDPAGIIIVGLFYFILGGAILEYSFRFQQPGTSRTYQRRARLLFYAFLLTLLTIVDYFPAYGVDIIPVGALPIMGFAVLAIIVVRRHRLVDFTPSLAAGKVFETAADPIFLCDRTGNVRVANQAVRDVLGYDPEECEGKDFLEQFLYQGQQTRQLGEIMAEPDLLRNQEVYLQDHQGQQSPASLSVAPLTDQSGEIVGSAWSARDLTAQKQVEQQLRESRQRYELAARGAQDGLWDWEIPAGKVFYSARWREMLGLEREGEYGTLSDWLERVHPEDRQDLKARIGSHLQQETPHLRHEHRIQHADGGWRWMLCRGEAVFDDNEDPIRMAGSQTDITERKTVEAQLRHKALHDELTGLANRTLLQERIQQRIARATRHEDEIFALLYMDLDRFKMINDSWGHDTGDAVLQKIAERLGGEVREADTLARLGGDEFGALLETVSSLPGAQEAARRLLETLEEPIEIESRQFHVDASVGLVLGNGQYTEAEQMIRDADIAMYRAKKQQGSQIALFDREMYTDVVARVEREEELREALEVREQLILYYQPLVDLKSGKLQGVEALLRWQHPEKGLLYPGQFLNVAEDSGLIVNIEQWVLQRVLTQIEQWEKQEFPCFQDLIISVNLAAQNVERYNLPEFLGGLLEQHPLENARLGLEVTEDALLETPHRVLDTFRQLRKLDITIAVDDFGTGYSSLQYLQQLPVEVLKIDRKFIQNLGHSSDDQSIVRAVAEMAHRLDMKVVAEGVETSEQLHRVRTIMQETTIEAWGQGFLWLPPVSVEEIEEVWQGQHHLNDELSLFPENTG